MSLGLSAATWVSLGGAALGAASGGSGGTATQSTDRSPWSGAQPWINSNIQQGQALQSQYQANPFNQGQKQAYGNMGATSDYVRQQLPQLLGTLNQQGGGFDRSNVNARPPSFQFGNGGSNLGLGPSYGAASPSMQADFTASAAPAATAPAAPADAGFGSPEWYMKNFGYIPEGGGGGYAGGA